MAKNGNPPFKVDYGDVFLITFRSIDSALKIFNLSSRKEEIMRILEKKSINISELVDHLRINSNTARKSIKTLLGKNLVRQAGVVKASKYGLVRSF